jgi:hypothetical protein
MNDMAFVFKHSRTIRVQIKYFFSSSNWSSFDRLHRWLRFTYTFCGFFSLPFLFLTLFFYITLPELGNFQAPTLQNFTSYQLVKTFQH